MAKQLRMGISFPQYDKAIYDFLDQQDNASALIRQLVGLYMSGAIILPTTGYYAGQQVIQQPVVQQPTIQNVAPKVEDTEVKNEITQKERKVIEEDRIYTESEKKRLEIEKAQAHALKNNMPLL